MDPFVYHQPTQVIFGKGRIREASSLCRAKRVFLISDPQAAEQSGALSALLPQFSKDALVHFPHAVSSPEASECLKAAHLYIDSGCDFILALGGGSCADFAKFTAALVPSPERAEEFYQHGLNPELIREAAPVGVVPTLIGSGAELTWAAVISNTRTQEKRVIRSKALFPKFALLDSNLWRSAPPRIIQESAFDALLHGLEHYLTPRTDAQLQNALNEAVIDTIIKAIERLPNEEDLQATQESLAMASLLALNNWPSMGCPRDFATHAISYFFTPRYQIPHAKAVCALYPSVLRELISAKGPQLIRLAQQVFKLHAPTAEDAVSALEAFFLRFDMPTRLSSLGIRENAIAPALRYFETHGPREFGESRFGLETLEKILIRALTPPQG